MARNLKLILAYDGTEYAGWQVQPELSTVQGLLASAIGRLTGENVLPQGSGRTDAGVHALGQVATFVTESAVPTENFQKALNDLLPAAVRVLDVREMPAEFHARKSAQAKTYRYRMYRGGVCSPFVARWVWHYPYPLDESAMERAAEEVVGERDFTSFAAVDAEKRSTEYLVPSTEWGRTERESLSQSSLGGRGGRGKSLNHQGHEEHEEKREHESGERSNVRRIFESQWAREGEEFVYTVRGNGFLHHMVRNLVGTFVLVGKGTLRIEDIGRILEARNRSAAGATAPASGLCLVGVEYEGS